MAAETPASCQAQFTQQRSQSEAGSNAATFGLGGRPPWGISQEAESTNQVRRLGYS
jgi:hypothetical protein